MRKAVILLLPLMVLALAEVSQAKIKYPKVKVGRKAPSFFLRDLNERLFFLSEYCGPRKRWGKKRSVLILDFFATWCEPCKKELPEIVAVFRKWRKRGVKLAVVGWREGGDKLKPFFDKHFKGTYGDMTILSDKYGIVAKKFGVKALPVTMILDRRCRIQALFKGEKKDIAHRLGKVLTKVHKKYKKSLKRKRRWR